MSGWQTLDLEPAFRNRALSVMDGILFQVLAEISPATTDSHHYSFAAFTDKTNVQLDWGTFARTM